MAYFYFDARDIIDNYTSCFRLSSVSFRPGPIPVAMFFSDCSANDRRVQRLSDRAMIECHCLSVTYIVLGPRVAF